MNSSQTNVKSVIIAAQSFFPTANKAHAAVLGLTTGAVALPPQVAVGLSAYMASKTAMIKTLEFLAAENPKIFVASVHPGNGRYTHHSEIRRNARPDTHGFWSVSLR